MKKLLRLSYSSLSFFFDSGCPRAWKFYLTMRPKAINEAMQRGQRVHKMLEGKLDPAKAVGPEKMFFDKLASAVDMLGLKITKKEFERKLRIENVVELVQVIDAVATDMNGDKVIVDYKTAGSSWKGLEAFESLIIPQARSLQAVSYLMPGGNRGWPKRMLYLVAPYRGPAQVLEVVANKGEIKNFLEVITYVREVFDRGKFPKVPGYRCHECVYKHACYEYAGWEDLYAPADRSSVK